MAKKRGRHAKGGRVTPKGTRPKGQGGLGGSGGIGGPFDQPRRHRREPDMGEIVRDLLATGQPLSLLSFASQMLSIGDPRNREPFDDDDVAETGPMLTMLLDVDQPEATALLVAFAALTDDEVLRVRIRRGVADRIGRHALPRWLTELERATVSGVYEMVHVLGDGDNIMIGVVVPHGGSFTLVAYVDHNMGTLVKDAFAVPGPLEEVLGAYKSIAASDPDTRFDPLEPAVARARIEEALELNDMTVPRIVSDSWPGCRHLLDWALAMMPEGGTGWDRPEVDQDERAAIVDAFFASSWGAPLDDADHRGLVGTFVWFAADYGSGDPMRWSPVSVEVLLASFLPRKVLDGLDYLSKAPDVLRAFVSWCHEQRGIPAELTAETVAAVDTWTPLLLDEVANRGRRSGGGGLGGAPGALPSGGAFIGLLAELGVIGDDGAVDVDALLDVPPEVLPPELVSILLGDDPDEADEWDETWDPADFWRGHLQGMVGPTNIDGLDAVALPVEEFDWSVVPDDVMERTEEVLAAVDLACDELFDDEIRTACYRLLATAIDHDPSLIRRRGNPVTLAGGLVWAIAKTNGAFQHGYGLRMADVLGVSSTSFSSRATTLLRAAGYDQPDVDMFHLRRADLLTGDRRARLIDVRDRYLYEI